ncbi:MAG: anthranilate synthase component I family protein [Gammaproteobacteria bacterium]|nr:anthranilate synthase component I family protein [Gammaproteobacteria bacterium]
MKLQVSSLEKPFRSFPLRKYLNLVKEKEGILLHSGKKNLYHQFHFVGYDPIFSYTEKNLIFFKENLCVPINDKNWLDKFIKKNRMKSMDNYPFHGGMLGYFSYEYKFYLEEKGLFKKPNLSIPLCEMTLYETVLVFNTRIKKYLTIKQYLKKEVDFFKLLKKAKKPINSNVNHPKGEKQHVNKVKQNQTWFQNNIQKIKRHILNGDIYQVNLTRRVEGDFWQDEVQLAEKLFKLNPAPMQGYLRTKNISLISSSPERFFRKRNKKIESFPIKGTIHRGKSPEEDKSLKKKLRFSIKDRGELAMIVDLIQNDLAKVSITNTLKVENFPKLDSYKNVHHLYAVISSETKKDNVAVFKALFPGGSVTGCPKIKACQILENLEIMPRETYTGCLGYFSFDDQCDFNILIRTIAIKEKTYSYQVGGGITLLSDPINEWMETVAKEESLVQILTTN